MSLFDNLIAHWKMNDNAANATVVDETGNHNGIFKDATGDPNTDAHSVAGALDFDGTDDYVEIADHDDFSFGDGTDDSPFSISAWIYMDDNTCFMIVNKMATDNNEWIFDVTAGKVRFSLDKNDRLSSQGRKYDTVLSTSTWYHVVATYDGSGGITAHDGMKIYVDGERKDDIDHNALVYTAMTGGISPVWIGRYGISYSNGKIDNVMIFNKELSAAEVSLLSWRPKTKQTTVWQEV